MPLDTTIFSFPQGLSWMMLGVALFFSAILAFAITMQMARPSYRSLWAVPLYILVYGSCIALSLRTLSSVRARVAVNADGVHFLPRTGVSTFIVWRDVTSVKAHDTKQQLVLNDAGGKRISLSYQIQDFAKLRDFVLAHTAESACLPATRTDVYHRSLLGKSVLLAGAFVTLLSSGVSYHYGHPFVSVFIVLYTAFLLILFARDPSRVVIASNAFVIKYPGWERIVSFDSIGKIALIDVRSRGNIWATVIIESRPGKPIQLRRFREGSIALHHALQSAWLSAGKDRGPADAK